MTTITASHVQDLFAYDGTADVVEVKRPPGGVLRSAGGARAQLKHARSKRTIFVPQDYEPFQLKLDDNLWAAAGRAMATLCGFDVWGGPHFEGITDLDLVDCHLRFPYTEMHRNARTRAIYADRAKAGFFQGAQRVRFAACQIDAAQGGVVVNGTRDLHAMGCLWTANFGGPTTEQVHPDALGCVTGGFHGLALTDSTLLHYPRFVMQGEEPMDFVFGNLWMAANVLPLQFMPDHPKGTITGALSKLRIWFTGETRAYRIDSGSAAYRPGQYSTRDPRIHVEERDVQVVAGKPPGPGPHQAWWDQEPLDLARTLRDD